jgi:hypothetical protein
MSEDLDLKRPPRKKPERKTRPRQYIAPDGKSRGDQTERRLNECFAICFASQTGQEVRNYLRSITTNAAFAPGTDPNIIVQMEGARWLMGIIDSRIKDGEEKKP